MKKQPSDWLKFLSDFIHWKRQGHGWRQAWDKARRTL
jgi:hypothetical protein